MKNSSILLAWLLLSCGQYQKGQPEVAREAWAAMASANGASPTGEASFSRQGGAELDTAYFASGCFWCVEAIYESVRGVTEAVSGYAGGEERDPTYEAVAAGRTGHTETVMVIYQPAVIDYQTLLQVYYGSHNPTTVNGQAPDFGRQYRSAIFYTIERERKIAEAFKEAMNESGKYDAPMATEIKPLQRFWPAEAYHQDYERKNPNQPYILRVSKPRLQRFQAAFPELLKENSQGH